MEKKKVLMVANEGLGQGGIQVVMMHIIKNLSERFTFDILLFTSQTRYYDKVFLNYGGKIIRIPFYEGKCHIRRLVDRYIRGLSLYFKILRSLQDNGPYIAIHCNNAFESALCVHAAKKVKIPVRIVHTHVSPDKPNIVLRFLNSVYRRIINHDSTLKVGCSKQACDYLYGENVESFVVNNPYDELLFSNEVYPAKESAYPIELVQVGRFDDNKNQLFSVNVLNWLVKKYPNAHLNLIGFGDESYVKSLKNKIDLLDLTQNVSFYESSSNIPEIMSRCHAFILPSKHEGFGIALIEAQAMQLKCFVSDTVPRTTNVGGCSYLSLNEGAEMWAKTILSTSFEKRSFDCSAFRSKNIADFFAEKYEVCL